LFKARGALGEGGNPVLDLVIRAEAGIYVSVSGGECTTQGAITS